MTALPHDTTPASALRPYVALAPRLRGGELTARGFLELCLETIARREPDIGAFVHMDLEAARQAADAATERWRRGKPLSPIDGMPVGIKDIIETIEMPTGQGSPLWQGFATRRDAATVHALREAGAVILGKTATTEFASTFPTTTRNPHDPARTPGGSSSGSAAAVAAAMLPAALGTQVVGSILRPASFCGCVGFKPSVGAINRGGSYDYLSQSCHGVLSATLVDAWAVARAIAERIGGDPGHPGLAGNPNLNAPARPARLALLETCGWQATTEGARRAFAPVVDRIKQAGITVATRRDDPEIEACERLLVDAMETTRRINCWEFRWPLNTYGARDISKLSAPARERLTEASAMTQDDYQALLDRRAAARAAFRTIAGRYDAFVTLAATGAAPVGLGSTGDPSMNVSASLLGTPAIALPLLEESGMPLGLQLIGAAERDAQLFEAASALLSGVLDRPDLIG